MISLLSKLRRFDQAGAVQARQARPLTPLPDRPVAGLLWMAFSGLCFVAVTATVKAVASGLPAAQSAFLRFLFGLLFALPALAHVLRAWPSGNDLARFALRAGLHTLAVLCWFFAMTRLPIAEVTAMSYLTPVFSTVGAALFLREGFRLSRLLALGVAVFGALIVLRPGMRALDAGHLAMLGTTGAFALSYLVARPLALRYKPAVVVGMLSLLVTLFLAPIAAVVWVPVGLTEVFGLLLVAAFATAGHFAMTRAFSLAPLGVTQPATALQLVWSVLIGSLFFSESVDMFVLLGGAVIVTAVVALAVREARKARALVSGKRPGERLPE